MHESIKLLMEHSDLAEKFRKQAGVSQLIQIGVLRPTFYDGRQLLAGNRFGKTLLSTLMSKAKNWSDEKPDGTGARSGMSFKTLRHMLDHKQMELSPKSKDPIYYHTRTCWKDCDHECNGIQGSHIAQDATDVKHG